MASNTTRTDADRYRCQPRDSASIAPFRESRSSLYEHVPNTDLAAVQAEDSLSSESRLAQAGNINILLGRERPVESYRLAFNGFRARLNSCFSGDVPIPTGCVSWRVLRTGTTSGIPFFAENLLETVNG